jgi:hypothetical protein
MRSGWLQRLGRQRAILEQQFLFVRSGCGGGTVGVRDPRCVTGVQGVGNNEQAPPHGRHHWRIRKGGGGVAVVVRCGRPERHEGVADAVDSRTTGKRPSKSATVTDPCDISTP